jgi:hypothetical protein
MVLWHMLDKETDYFRVRLALLVCEYRSIERKTGLPIRRGCAYGCNIPERWALQRSCGLPDPTSGKRLTG